MLGAPLVPPGTEGLRSNRVKSVYPWLRTNGMLENIMQLSDANLLGWRFPGLRRLSGQAYPEILPCSRCGHPVSRALDPRGNVLGVEFAQDDTVEVHACFGARQSSTMDHDSTAIFTVFGPLLTQHPLVQREEDKDRPG